MSGYDVERSAIETYFSDAWAEATPIAWQNVDFVPPDNDYWVRFSIVNGSGFQASMGDTQVHRFPSQVVVQIFAPQNVGTGRIKELAEIVVDMFSVKQIGAANVQFRVPYIINVGEVNGLYQINVIAPFYRNKYFAA